MFKNVIKQNKVHQDEPLLCGIVYDKSNLSTVINEDTYDHTNIYTYIFIYRPTLNI